MMGNSDLVDSYNKRAIGYLMAAKALGLIGMSLGWCHMWFVGGFLLALAFVCVAKCVSLCICAQSLIC